MENQHREAQQNLPKTKSNLAKEPVAITREWLRPKEAQAYLGIGHDNYYSLVRSGTFQVSKPSGKLAYVRKSDLDAWIERGVKAKKETIGKAELNHPPQPPNTTKKITSEHLETLIQSETYSNTGKTTVCILTLHNGFEVVGSSGIVDASQFDEELGDRYAREAAINALWQLEGYRLQWTLAEKYQDPDESED